MSLVVPPELSGERLDIVLRELAGVSRREARRLISDGAVFLDNKRVRVQSRVVTAGARLRVGNRAPADAPTLELPVLFESPECLIINKPSGMPSAPTRQRAAGTALEVLRKQRSERLLLVHRLDHDTSGALCFARSPRAAARLSQAFRQRTARRIYLGLTVQPRFTSERITLPLRMTAEGVAVVDPGGRDAETLATVLARGAELALVCLEPITGRSHQLRAHLAALDAPLLGDRRYGGPVAIAPDARCFGLHAAVLALPGLPVIAAPPPAAWLRAASEARLPRAAVEAALAAAAALPEWT